MGETIEARLRAIEQVLGAIMAEIDRHEPGFLARLEERFQTAEGLAAGHDIAGVNPHAISRLFDWAKRARDESAR